MEYDRAEEIKQIKEEIKAFEAQESSLEKHHMHKFVVFRGGELVGTWDDLNAAADDAVRRFGRGPYLIRQVGAPPAGLPASVYAHPVGTA